MVEPDRPQMAVRLVSFACWISKGTNRHQEYEILPFRSNNGDPHAPRYCLYMYIACIVILWFVGRNDFFIAKQCFAVVLVVAMATSFC